MPIPSVFKIQNGNVEYVSKIDITKYAIKELSHRAMLDVGRYITQNVRKRMFAFFPFTGKRNNSKRYQYWVLKKEDHLLLGVENIKKGAKTAWWADQLELDKFITPKISPEKRRQGQEKRAVTMEARYMYEHLDGPAYRAWLKERDLKNLKKYRTRVRKRVRKPKLLGTPNNPRRHILETFAKTHIDTIIEIESQYLSKINDEDAAIALAQATEEMEVLRGDEN